MAPAETIECTVAWSEPGRELLLPVRVPAGATLADAVRASGLLQQAALDATALDLGVFGHARPATQPVRAGDRIEVYRPLTVDPKEARRVRVAVKRRRQGGAPRPVPR